MANVKFGSENTIVSVSVSLVMFNFIIEFAPYGVYTEDTERENDGPTSFYLDMDAVESMIDTLDDDEDQERPDEAMGVLEELAQSKYNTFRVVIAE